MVNQLALNPAFRLRVAESSQKGLLTKFLFWKGQWEMMAIATVSVLVLILLAPYTYDYAEGWVFLTIFVQALAVWGCIIAAKAVARIEIETAIVIEIEARGGNYLRAIQTNQIKRVDLDRLQQEMVPNNTSVPTPAMIRLFQHICKEAKDRRFESSVNVIQPYREEALEDIFKLQNLQKIALWLGILGTFIGLLLAIQVQSLGASQKGDDFLQLINRMFEKLFISFSASLAGLETAVILGFLLLLLRKRQEVYFKSMESAVVGMLSLARNAINRDDFIAEFNQISTSVSQLRDSVYDQTKEYSERLREVQKGIKDQTEHIQSGISKLSNASLEFDGFLNSITNTQKEFIDDVKSVYDVISLKNMSAALHESVIQAGSHISQALNGNVKEISTQLASFNNSITGLSRILERQAREASAAAKGIENKIKAQSEENAAIIKQIAEQLGESINRGTTASNEFRSTLHVYHCLCKTYRRN